MVCRLLLAGCLALAVKGQIGVPTAGYVFNPATSALHPITGLLGAATLGPAILTGVDAASYSPDQDLAVVSRPDGVFVVSGVQSGAPQYQALSGVSGGFLVAWGKASAVVYSAGGFQLLSPGGSLSPMAVEAPAGPVTAIDFDEASRRVFVSAVRSADGQRLYAIDADLRQVTVTDLAGNALAPIPLSFVPTKLERLGTSGLLLLSNEAGQPVWVLKDAAEPAVYFVPRGGSQ